MMLEAARPFRWWLVLAAATAWLCLSLPVFSQEAYYWAYAQRPDLSYFDHPPMVAWLIWLGTTLGGNTAGGIRLGTWLCGMCATWMGWCLLRDFGVDKKGQDAWILFGVVSPIVTMTHFLANPDAPLVCFWTVTMFALWRARDGKFGWWLLAGAAAGCALLSKYSAAFLAIGGAVTLLLDPRMRSQLRRPGPWVAVAVAAVVFLPVVWWNVANHFESFRFQTANRFEKSELGSHWAIALLTSQFGLLHPAIALLVPPAVWSAAKLCAKRDMRALWLLAFGLPLPLYLLFSSLWIQVKMNWLAPAYVPLMLALVVWWRQSGVADRRARQLRWVMASLLVLPLVLPLAPFIRLVPASRGSSWTGWDQIAERAEIWEDKIDEVDGIEGNVFFFAADYKDSAQLARNLRLYWDLEGEHQITPGSPDSGEPTMAQNVLSMPALQFDHWEKPRGRIGQDAIFVLPRPDSRASMVDMASHHFHSIEKVERVNITRLGIHVVDADIYVCRDYRGPDNHQ